jgi:hypothetical protein
MVHGAERGVEPSDAAEAGGERDGRHRQRRRVDERLGALHPARGRHLTRRRAGVAGEQPAQVARRHAECVGEILDASTLVEEAALDQPERA